MLEDIAVNIAYLIGTPCGIGLVAGALSITGVGGAFSRELIQYGGGSRFLLPVLDGPFDDILLSVGTAIRVCVAAAALISW